VSVTDLEEAWISAGPALSVLVESRRAIPASRNFHAGGERAVIVAAR